MNKHLTVSSRTELESALASLTKADAGCVIYIESGEYA